MNSIVIHGLYSIGALKLCAISEGSSVLVIIRERLSRRQLSQKRSYLESLALQQSA